jgi:hypothetical protein
MEIYFSTGKTVVLGNNLHWVSAHLQHGNLKWVMR